MAPNPARIALLLVVALFGLAVLGVSVAVLVTVLNIQNKPALANPTTEAPNKNRTLPTVPTRTTESTTTAAPPPPPDDGGVPAAPVISELDRRYTYFKQVDDRLKLWMDKTINPCDDFYHYACQTGQKNNVLDGFTISDIEDAVLQITKYKDDKYFEAAPASLKRLKHFYDKCVTPDTTPADWKDSLTRKITSLKTDSGLNFPLLYQSEKVTPDAMTNVALAKLVGFARNDAGTTSLARIYVDQDWKTPEGETPYRIYFDQPPSFFLDFVYDNWETYRPVVSRQIELQTAAVAEILDLKIDQDILKGAATHVAELEYDLRKYVTTDVKLRRYQERNYNPKKVSDLQNSVKAFDWKELLKAAMTRANAADKIVDDLEIIVMEEAKLTDLNNDLIANKFDAETLSNLVQFRAMIDVASALPNLAGYGPESERQLLLPELKKLLRPKATLPGQPSIRKVPTDDQKLHNLLAAQDITEADYTCYMTVRDTLVEAGDRVFADAAYPATDDRTQIRKQIKDMTSWIMSGMRTQIDMLDWMSVDSKKGAYAKIDNIKVNIAFPEWVTNNELLDTFYKDLTFALDATTSQVYSAIDDFQLLQSVVNFRIQKPRDRLSFLLSVGQTNAFYTARSNAMIFPGGILHAPFFHPSFPAAVNFGGLGIASGHELTHGFDDQGVHWDYSGALNAWMLDDDKAKFDDMASCVIDQYSSFCPISKPKEVCVDGQNTQGENIADNGGIQAAYKAFKAYEAFNGPDPRLPSFGKVFTNDQLFFLSFANTWCSAEETPQEYAKQIETDPHSPALFRVLGTLQNFPAFRSAFNCPVGKAYTPVDHCDVWTSAPPQP